jgi:hypothetical protein
VSHLRFPIIIPLDFSHHTDFEPKSFAIRTNFDDEGSLFIFNIDNFINLAIGPFIDEPGYQVLAFDD